MGFGKEDHRGKVPLLIISYQGDLLSSQLISVDFEHDYLAEIVFVKFYLLPSYSFPAFSNCPLEGSHYVQPHT